MRVWYRVGQLWQALVASAPPEPPEALPPALRPLYLAMGRADRAHALRTYRRLAGRPADLALAALLHDVGKSASHVRLWHRVFYVLAARLAPGWLERGRPAGVAALRAHAEAGARQVEAAGGPPGVVRLIRYHHADPAALPWPAAERELLQALQRADQAS